MLLVAVGEGFEPREIILRGNVILGRCPEKPGFLPIRISIPHSNQILTLSRNHCSLVMQGNNVLLCDEGSNNGIFLNGVALAKNVPVPFPPNALLKLSKGRNPEVIYRLNLIPPSTPLSKLPMPPFHNSQEKNLPTLHENNLPTLRENSQEKNHTSVEKSFRENVRACLECPICQNLLRNPAVLACGHCFCACCLKVSNQHCPLCHTKIQKTREEDGGFAHKCLPLSALLGLVSTTSGESDNKVFVQVHDVDDDGDATFTRDNEDMEVEVAVDRCEYCAEPEHADGERCPHKRDEEEEDSDNLEEYV